MITWIGLIIETLYFLLKANKPCTCTYNTIDNILSQYRKKSIQTVKKWIGKPKEGHLQIKYIFINLKLLSILCFFSQTHWTRIKICNDAYTASRSPYRLCSAPISKKMPTLFRPFSVINFTTGNTFTTVRNNHITIKRANSVAMHFPRDSKS